MGTGSGPRSGVDLPRELAGLEVAITGRLASMTRAQATAALERAGARYSAAPGTSTDLLVYGGAGLPLGEDGRPTRALARAWELAERGVAIRIVPEERWLALLGEDARRAELHRLYTTGQLSRILDVTPAQVRAWVRHGLLQPAEIVHRLCFFDYQDVVQARSVAELSRSGVGPKRLQASLELLRRWLDDTDHPLARLEAWVDSGALCVRLDDGSWAEPSGQLRLDFDPDTDAAADAAAAAAADAPPAARVVPDAAGDDWFERGVRAEDRGRPEQAAHCYAAAEAAGDTRPEVSFNLGNALYELGRLELAVAAFERALDAEPDYLEAWNNLGNALARLGRGVAAVQAFRHALALAPGYADAHYNLAESLFESGALDAARRHWQAYLSIDPSSSWAGEVRARLAESETLGPATGAPTELRWPLSDRDPR